MTDRKIKRLRALTADIDNVYFNIKSERHSYFQALLSLGDRRVAPAIAIAEQNGQNWRAAVADAGIDGDFYIFRDRSKDAMLPWDIIDGGMKRPFFEAEFAKSLREEWTLPPKRAQENIKLIPVIHKIGRDRRALLVLLQRLENQIAQLRLSGAVHDGAEERVAAAVAVDHVQRAGNVTLRV